MKLMTTGILCFAMVLTVNSQNRLSYNPKEIKNWASIHNMDGKTFKAQHDKKKKNGFRIVFIDGYNVNGKVRFSAIWEKQKRPKLKFRYGMSGSEYQNYYDQYRDAGFKLVHIDGYSHDGKALYAAIWHKMDIKTRAKHGLKHKDFQEASTKNKADGYSIKHISAFSIKGTPYYSGIWTKQNNKKRLLRFNMNKDQFSEEFKKHTNNGYKTVHIDSYKANGTAKYAAIWEKRDGRFVAHSNLNSKNYQLRMENYYFQGYKPVSISGHDNAKNLGFTGVWEQVGGWKGKDTRQLDNKFRAIMKKYDIPGGALSIVKDGKLVYAKGYGWGVKDKEIASATSLWRIASISKPFTGVAIMKLTEDTNLDLEDKVFGNGALLGNTYGSKSYSEREKKINVRHLLEHRAGGNSWDNNTDPNPNSSTKEDEWNDPMFNSNVSDKNQKKTIDWLLDARNPSEPVNTVTAYSNVAYCILGRVIEKKSGLDYETYVKNKILKPCGISNMHIGSSYKNKRKYREVEYYDSGSYNVLPWRMDSHGGWIASVVDLMRFSVRVDGNPVKKDILKNGTVTTMQTSSYGGTYGKGWDVSGALMEHGGALPGTNSFLKLMNNGIYYAFTVNKRPSSKEGNFIREMKEAIQEGIDEINHWPLIDLF